MILFHGSHCNTSPTIHEGMCLTEDISVSIVYAGTHGTIHVFRIVGGLEWVEVAGYDHDGNDAPADCVDFRAEHAATGADILYYDDEDEDGREHDCVRLVSDRAISALVHIATIDADEAGCFDVEDYE